MRFTLNRVVAIIALAWQIVPTLAATTGIQAQIIPIYHSESSSAIVYVANGTYIPGPGITQIRATLKGGGGSGGAFGLPGNAGSQSVILQASVPLVAANGGLGGLFGSGGPSIAGQAGTEYAGWADTFPVGNRAGGLAGIGPGAGGGGVAGGGGGRTGNYIERQPITVVPGVAYSIFVGDGGPSVGASGVGAKGFVLIEW